MAPGSEAIIGSAEGRRWGDDTEQLLDHSNQSIFALMTLTDQAFCLGVVTNADGEVHIRGKTRVRPSTDGQPAREGFSWSFESSSSGFVLSKP